MINRLKNTLLMMLLCISVASCIWTKENPNNGEDDVYYDVVVMDSCEYINGDFISGHKGNCKFCAERRKKEIDYIIKALNQDKDSTKNIKVN